MLLRALVEAEIDGVAVANQLTALKETIDGLTKVGFTPKLTKGLQPAAQNLTGLFGPSVDK